MATILIIDDDSDFVSATASLLGSKGHEVLTATNGAEGYATAKRCTPDLILLDVMMTHDTEGLDTARLLREDPATKAIPVIVVSGVRKAKGLPAGLAPDPTWLPVSAVVEKPVRPDNLLSAIAAALR